MRIWRRDWTLEHMNAAAAGTLVETLGIRFVEAGDDYLKATMPVDRRTIQPYGLLHGGASVALAESLGSYAALLCLEDDRTSVGLEINANHVRAVRQGTVTGTARPIHVGRSTHVWEIRIVDEKNRLVCVSRITLAILDAPAKLPSE